MRPLAKFACRVLRVSRDRQVLPRRLFSGSRIYQSQNLTTKKQDKPTVLAYDPAGEGDFLSCGILPFLQGNLNKFLLLEDERQGPRPEHNAVPTSEQRKMLAVLNSNHSLILKGNYETGKSLALMTYVLNKALSRVPTYGPLKNMIGVQSIIILPTDDLIEKYRLYFTSLLEGIPDNCCPGELIPTTTADGNIEYNLTRKPLKIEFLSSTKFPHVLESATTDPNTPPQILVTRLSRLEDLLNYKYTNSHPSANIRHMKSVEFVAVDEFDTYLKTTGIKTDESVEQSSPKGKYKNRLEGAIRNLQSLTMNAYQDAVNAFIANGGVEPNDVEEGINDQTTISISDLQHKQNKFVREESEFSYKNVEKEAKKLTYKPIQYCFLTHIDHPYKEVLNTKVFLEENGHQDASNDELAPDFPATRSMKTLYEDITLQKANGTMKRVTDIETAFVEKMIRFNDDQRLVRKKERPLISVKESFALPENVHLGQEEKSKISAYFVYGVPHRTIGTRVARGYDLRDLDTTEMPGDDNILEVMEEHIRFAKETKGSFRDFEREFLKYTTAEKTAALGTTIMSEIVAAAVKRYRRVTNVRHSLCVVVPSDTNISGMILKLRRKRDTDSFFKKERFQPLDVKHDLILKYDQQDVLVERSIPIKGRTINLIVDSSQFIGHNYKGLTDVLVIGLNTLVTQSALSRKNTKFERIAGVPDVNSDMMNLVMAKLLKSPTFRPKNILFYVGTFQKGNAGDLNTKITRFSLMVAYNRILDMVNVKRFWKSSRAKKMLTCDFDEDTYASTMRDAVKHAQVKRTTRKFDPNRKRD